MNKDNKTISKYIKKNEYIKVENNINTEITNNEYDNISNNKKKRGRKPKDKFKYDNMNINDKHSKELEDNIIVKLPLSCLQLSDELLLNNSYNPILTLPEPYDKPHVNFQDLNIIQNNNISLCLSDKSHPEVDNINNISCASKEVNNISKEVDNFDINTKSTRQIDIILNNKYGCNIDKIQVLAHICNTNLDKNWYVSVNIACYRCSHTFTNTPWGIPIKYQHGKFYLTGIFCSPNCVLGYILNETRNDESVWEQIALLHMLYYNIYGTYINIMPSPDKICLQMFGGTIDIQTYRNITIDNYKSYTIEFPPCNTIIPMLEEIYKKNNLFSSFLPNEKLINKIKNNNTNNISKNLKLKRFTPINSSNNSLDHILNIFKK